MIETLIGPLICREIIAGKSELGIDMKRGALIISAIFVVVACAGYKPHIGAKVNYRSDYACVVTAFPHTCRMGRENDPFEFIFTIDLTSEPDQYEVKGTMDPTKGRFKSFTHLRRQDCNFYFLLARDAVVIDAVYFGPLGDELGKIMPFKFTFKSEPFDAVLIAGRAHARG